MSVTRLGVTPGLRSSFGESRQSDAQRAAKPSRSAESR
jgi:hypothetical protein